MQKLSVASAFPGTKVGLAQAPGQEKPGVSQHRHRVTLKV